MTKPHHHSPLATWDDPRMKRLISRSFEGAEILKVSALKSDSDLT